MNAPAYEPCRCGCRPRAATEPGCPCLECQPGPGLQPERKQTPKELNRRLRMVQLLNRKLLTPEEEAELDGLLSGYVQGDFA